MRALAQLHRYLLIPCRLLLQGCPTPIRALAGGSGLLPSVPAARDITRTILMLVGLTIALPAYADAVKHEVCTPNQARQAEAEANQLNDWDSMHRSFKRFAQCDEGTIAEEYSDSVSHLLARNWGQLDALLRLIASDRRFEQFVVRHIDESMTEDDANLIINNARLHCPQGAKQFCKLIVDY